MAPEIHGVVCATQAWLQSSWHVQVPFAWLEACVQWLQEEGGGAGRLTQQHINQQVLDQWLLTDLRDLDHAVLPEGLSQAHKTELSGTFCVQVDSLLDISQPAYGQLQKWRGTDCTNEEVSAVTQTTQRPWEAKPNRMLLLQVTDGVQSLEAMEYQPIPALSTALRPGVKLQLQGQIVCRLGMLLLGPANVKVLGGEVEDLVNRNSQGKVLCRTLGLPEEEQQDGEEGPPALPEGNQEAENLEVDDEELLASLEAQEEVERGRWGAHLESGYGTFSEASTHSSRGSSVRSHASTASSRSEASTPSYRSASVQRHRRLEDSDLVAPVSSTCSTPPDVTDYNMADEDFPDEDFDDLPLDELDSIIFHENTNITPQSDSSHRSRPQTDNRTAANPSSFDRATKPQTDRCDREPRQQTLNDSGSRLGSDNSRFARPDKHKGQLAAVTSNPYLPSASSSSHDGGQFLTDDETVFLDEDMDSCFITEIETGQAGLESTHSTTQEMAQVSGSGRQERFENVNERPQGLCQSRLGIDRAAIKTESADSKYRLSSQSPKGITDIISMKTTPTFASAHSTTQGRSYTSSAINVDGVSVGKDPQCDSSTVPALTLTSLPFTYLRLLQERISKQHLHTAEIRVKAFIVTLLGKLTSSNGVWRVCATISDGSGYLDVELSDEVLTGLLGFSVAEKAVLKRDPARRGELDTGMKRCQEALVDMCCVMAIVVEPQGRRAVVTKAEPVTEKVLQALEQRVRDRRK
ncbi:recQ-mediated genome instability protein 1 [Myripristis murdjan]|uniref:RecQ-mediated genome instability protein 1 n=1 Tax=Myripristis murdjan TaxID=586833 RepID=A0A668AX56_9TELE|nr:recQ-mediated genome instability protein 1 [Myripristis murdjan]XP_029916646.1 recQ-mediated genome instability protein 1 [Myripristis murdjan]